MNRINIKDTLSLEDIKINIGDSGQNNTGTNLKVITSSEAHDIVREMNIYSRIYKDDDAILYINNEDFKPSIEWAKKMKELYISSQLKTRWKYTVEQTSISPEIIKDLSEAGLKVLTIEVKSLSYSKLQSMQEIENPYDYLKNLECLLLTCQECGIFTTINIPLYPNEENIIVEETKQWLKERKSLIRCATAVPTSVDNTELDIKSLADTIKVSLDISKTITTDADYFDLKKFAHFQNTYTYKDFINDIKNIDPNTLPFITPWEDKFIHNKKIVIFGGMGTGKSLLTEFIEEELNILNINVHSHNIGDTCRFFMKIGNINPYWSNKTRSLGQQISSKLREVDKDLLNEVVFADITQLDETSNDNTVHIVTGGRTLEDFKYWNKKDYLTIGIVSSREDTAERLKSRDNNQIQDDNNLAHETEINTDFISRNLCRVLIDNNGTIDDLRDKAKEIIYNYIIK